MDSGSFYQHLLERLEAWQAKGRRQVWVSPDNLAFLDRLAAGPQAPPAASVSPRAVSVAPPDRPASLPPATAPAGAPVGAPFASWRRPAGGQVTPPAAAPSSPTATPVPASGGAYNRWQRSSEVSQPPPPATPPPPASPTPAWTPSRPPESVPLPASEPVAKSPPAPPAPLAPPPTAPPPAPGQASAIEIHQVPPEVTFDLAPPPDPAVATASWDELEALVRPCTRCPLCSQGRTQTVFGVGDRQARLMFIGEGPGADEDATGEPFVGKAGQLLTKMIEAMSLTRSQVYIANIVKCRPPGNRPPDPLEGQTCLPYLQRQIALIQPDYLVVLGGTPLLHLLGLKGITSKRGRWYDYRGIPVMATFHPSYLLRMPGEKGKAWEDLKQVMRAMGLGPGTSSRTN